MTEERFKQLAERCTLNHRIELSIIESLKEAVNEALEEAAKLCDEASDLHANGEGFISGAEYCASEIRQKKTTR